MNSRLRLFLDLGPLLAFFLAYRFVGLMAATVALVVFTLLSLVITYWREKKISVMPLVSGIAVTILGGLTLYLHNDTFIKVKPTLVNLLFASVLLGGLCFGKSLMKFLLDHALQLEEEGWRKLTLRWGIFFVFLAVMNEIIWRNFSTDFWVNFKVFGMFTMTLLFTLCQLPLIKKYWVESDPEAKEP